MHQWRCGLAGTVALLMLLGIGSAFAETDDAKSCYEKGLVAFALAEYGTAAEWYEKAFRLKPGPELLYNAAQSYRLAGNKERALVLYQNYLRVFGGQIRNRADVESHIAELERAIRADRKAAQSLPVTPVPVRGGSAALRPQDAVSEPAHSPALALPMMPPIAPRGTARVTSPDGFVSQNDNWTSWHVCRIIE